MTAWCASQLPAIARRVLAEEQDGRPADPHRKAWAEQVLAFSTNEATRVRAFGETATKPDQQEAQA